MGMKSFMITLGLFCLNKFYSQENGDRILGTWLTADKRSEILIYKEGNLYYGKIVWILDSIDPKTNKPWTDVLNPDPDFRGRLVSGLTILSAFRYEPGFGKYQGGSLYFPRNGKTYRGKMWLSDANTLQMRGYVFIFYQTDEWMRISR